MKKQICSIQATSRMNWGPHNLWTSIGMNFPSTRVIQVRYGKKTNVEEPGCSISKWQDRTKQRAQSISIRVVILGNRKSASFNAFVLTNMIKEKAVQIICRHARTHINQATYLLLGRSFSADHQMVWWHFAYLLLGLAIYSYSMEDLQKEGQTPWSAKWTQRQVAIHAWVGFGWLVTYIGNMFLKV